MCVRHGEPTTNPHVRLCWLLSITRDEGGEGREEMGQGWTPGSNPRFTQCEFWEFCLDGDRTVLPSSQTTMKRLYICSEASKVHKSRLFCS